MTAHNHYCKSCAEARKGAPVPYDQLDPEMVDVVRAINTIPGIRTLDSCFGHPGSGDPHKSHQAHAYVGLAPTGGSKENLIHFWRDFFDVNYGKLDMPTGWVQFNLVWYPFDPDPVQLIRLNIDCEHDPFIDPRGAQEKKEAFLFLQKFIAEYNQTHAYLMEQQDGAAASAEAH